MLLNCMHANGVITNKGYCMRLCKMYFRKSLRFFVCFCVYVPAKWPADKRKLAQNGKMSRKRFFFGILAGWLRNQTGNRNRRNRLLETESRTGSSGNRRERFPETKLEPSFPAKTVLKDREKPFCRGTENQNRKPEPLEPFRPGPNRGLPVVTWSFFSLVFWVSLVNLKRGISLAFFLRPQKWGETF